MPIRTALRRQTHDLTDPGVRRIRKDRGIPLGQVAIRRDANVPSLRGVLAEAVPAHLEDQAGNDDVVKEMISFIEDFWTCVYGSLED